MAKQNFVAGGFYGKLGQLVGQRWKNIRVVKVYTIPSNPRTAKQQANRGVFKEATKRAQLANSMNFRTPAFDTSVTPEWGQRVSVATSLMKSTQKPFDQIPLYPLNYAPEYMLDYVKKGATISANTVRFFVTGALPEEDRALSVLVGYWNETTEAYDIELFSTTLKIDTESYFDLTGERITEADSTSIFLIASRDDKEHENEAVYMPQTNLDAGAETWDSTVLSVTRSGTTFTITFAQDATTAESTEAQATIVAVSAGRFVMKTVLLTISVVGGKVTGTFNQNDIQKNSEILAFPNGSALTISGLVIVDSEECTPSIQTIQSYENTDLTREIDITSSAFSQTEGVINITLSDKVNPQGAVTMETAVQWRNFVIGSHSASQNANVGFNGNNTTLQLAVKDYGSISQCFLYRDSTIAIVGGFVSNGVTYIPNDITAKAYNLSDHTLEFTLNEPTEAKVGGVTSLLFDTGIEWGSGYASPNTVRTVFELMFANDFHIMLAGSNLTTGEDGDFNNLDLYPNPTSATEKLKLRGDFANNISANPTDIFTAQLVTNERISPDMIASYTRNYIILKIDSTPYGETMFESSRFNPVQGTTVTFEEA